MCHEILGVVGGIRHREQGSVECQFIQHTGRIQLTSPKHRTKIVRRIHTRKTTIQQSNKNNPAQNKGGTTYYI